MQLNINSKAKVLVTGGAGFFGSHICEKLLDNGQQVVVADILNNDTSSLAQKINHVQYLEEKYGAQYKFHKIDILEEESLSQVLKAEAPTRCIHAAALVMDRKSVEEPIRYIINNIQGTQSLLNAIQKTNTIKHFVLVSSRSAVGEVDASDDKVSENALLHPINPYGATKASMEALCYAFYKNFGLSMSICRMQPLYGPRCRQDMIPSLLFESALHNTVVKKFGNGEAVRDWLYVEDAALGILAALKYSKMYSIFNFGTGIGTTLNDLIQLVKEITGKNLNLVYENVPRGDAIFAGICDTRKARKILNWKSKTDLRTGLKMMYEYMKEHEESYQ